MLLEGLLLASFVGLREELRLHHLSHLGHGVRRRKVRRRASSLRVNHRLLLRILVHHLLEVFEAAISVIHAKVRHAGLHALQLVLLLLTHDLLCILPCLRKHALHGLRRGRRVNVVFSALRQLFILGSILLLRLVQWLLRRRLTRQPSLVDNSCIAL